MKILRLLPFAALLAVPAAPVAANEIANPGFEENGDEPVSWETPVMAGIQGGEPLSEVRVVSEGAAGGERCLELSGDSRTAAWRAAEQGGIPVEAGRRYLLAGKMRTRKVRKVGNQYFNCNLYVRFLDAAGRVIRTPAGYPVLGTLALAGTVDWRPVRRVVEAPEGAVQASVGCFLSCSGTAWFDDVRFQALEVPEWNEMVTDRFVVRWEGEETPPAEVVAGNEAHLAAMERLLGTSHPDPVFFYKYADNERKEEITGDPGNAHVENGNEIHSVFWGDRHEIVHILTLGWGKAPALFAEGLAVHLSGGWQGRPVDAWAGELARSGKLLDLAGIAATVDFRRQPDTVTYPEAGSWVKYLIEAHGMGAFRDLYARLSLNPTSQELERAFAEAYGSSFREEAVRWRAGIGER